MNTVPVITIDGPSGSGKGTLCANLATQIGWHRLDSGVIYRLLALAAQRQAIPVSDESALAACAHHLEFEFQQNDLQESLVLFEGEDVTSLLRGEACASLASRIAGYESVRHALLQKQREFCKEPGLVADGRDMGTVVFPQADLKIFLTASVEERARRRFEQLKRKGIDVNLLKILEDLKSRDQLDISRIASPLKPAVDAILIDSTHFEAEAVLKEALSLVSDRLGIRVSSGKIK